MGYTPPPNPSPLNTPAKDVMFIDIETVPKVKNFTDLDDRGQLLFIKRYKEIEDEHQKNGTPNKKLTEAFIQKTWEEKAAFHAEFNQVVCVALGVIAVDEVGARTLRLLSFEGDDEKQIFADIAPKLAAAKFLCAHNGKRFDFPVIARRHLINGLPMPSILQIMGLKPWEINLFDTMEMWGFGDLRATVSLDTLAYSFGLPSPKDSMSGADVARYFYGDHELPWEKEDALKAIGNYCRFDVQTLANVYLMMIGQPPIENIVTVNK